MKIKYYEKTIGGKGGSTDAKIDKLKQVLFGTATVNLSQNLFQSILFQSKTGTSGLGSLSPAPSVVECGGGSVYR